MEMKKIKPKFVSFALMLLTILLAGGIASSIDDVTGPGTTHGDEAGSGGG